MGTATMPRKETVVSAPGKVLIAGGYLVLDPAYPGLVISTTSRFYTVIRTRSEGAADSGRCLLRVFSPQFVGAQWDFVASVDGEEIKLTQTKETYNAAHAGPNPFLSLSILYALRVAKESCGIDAVTAALSSNGVDITVLADNDFYSQRSSGSAPSTSDLESLPPFKSQKKPIRDVHKTGLGSSAAMTTSLVGALLIHLGAVACNTDSSLPAESLALIHNTAQLAHCAAQGKVGSGFDVSAAVWGSHLFRRFDKEVIQAVLDRGEKVHKEGASNSEDGKSTPLLPALEPSNPLWHPSPLSSGKIGETHPTAVEGFNASFSDNSKVARPAPMALPPRFEMVLADVDAGSNTPSLVGKVSEWKKNKPEWAKQLYRILASANQTLADTLFSLTLVAAQDAQAYDQAVEDAASRPSKEWDALVKEKPSAVLKLLIEARNAMRSVQGGMREMGRQTGAPVEPNEMGDVIKASIDGAKGIVGGGVPGAGGYDALFLLYLRPPSVRDGELAPGRLQVEQVWSQWTALSVGPLLSSAGGSANANTASIEAHANLLSQVHGGIAGKQAGATSTSSSSSSLTASASRANSGGLRLVGIDEVKGLREALSRGG